MRYLKLTALYESLDATSKRLAKVWLLSQFFSSLKQLDSAVFYLAEGRIFADWDQRKIGVASRIVVKALCRVGGVSEPQINSLYVQLGDYGLVAEKVFSTKSQTTFGSTHLTVARVYKDLTSLAEMSGDQTVARKLNLITGLLSSATPLEAKYLVRTLLDEMRIGVGEGSIRDSLVWAYFSSEIGLVYDEQKNSVSYADVDLYKEIAADVLRAYNLTSDFFAVAQTIQEKGRKGLTALSLTVGRPVKMMLFLKSENLGEALEKLGPRVACEYKFDGFRCEIHGKGSEVTLFTRRLENVTPQFPDVVAAVCDAVVAKDYILDAEILGVDPVTGGFLSFQHISQRIKRKHNIEALAAKIPVVVRIFDVLYFAGKSTLTLPFSQRRALLAGAVDASESCMLAEQIVTDSLPVLEEFYEKSLALGHEGVMVKSLSAIYQPGARVGFGMKVKPTLETLDLVIIGAEWGHGKRKNVLSSFEVACKKDDTYVSLGMVGTGVKEKEEMGLSFTELTTLLTPHVLSSSGSRVTVAPHVIVEVSCEEIQTSTKYSSGYALRFPRILRLRADKPLDEITTLAVVAHLFLSQRGRNHDNL